MNHPRHKTPIKSPRYDSMPLGPLTDAKILSYIRAGRYGPDLKLQQARIDRKAAALDAETKPRKSSTSLTKLLLDF